MLNNILLTSFYCMIFNTKLTIHNKIIWLTLSMHVTGSYLLYDIINHSLNLIGRYQIT